MLRLYVLSTKNVRHGQKIEKTWVLTALRTLRTLRSLVCSLYLGFAWEKGHQRIAIGFPSRQYDTFTSGTPQILTVHRPSISLPRHPAYPLPPAGHLRRHRPCSSADSGWGRPPRADLPNTPVSSAQRWAFVITPSRYTKMAKTYRWRIRTASSLANEHLPSICQGRQCERPDRRLVLKGSRAPEEWMLTCGN